MIMKKISKRKITVTKMLVGGAIGTIVGKFIYDQYIKDTKLTEAIDNKVNGVKGKVNDFTSLFEKQETEEKENAQVAATTEKEVDTQGDDNGDNVDFE